jgi:ABC-type antimicrobial peptide transport system permease subunit
MYEAAKSNYDSDLEAYERAKENVENGYGDKRNLEYWEETIENDKNNIESTLNAMLEEYGLSTYEECAALRDDYSSYTYKKTLKTGIEYTVSGYYEDELSDEINVEMVLADDAQSYIMPEIIAYMGKCYIYADNEDAVTEYVDKLSDKMKSLVLKVENPYNTVMAEYRQDKAEQFSGRIIVTVTIFVVSMIILYFMMKANAVQRMQDLGVYRLIGISKASILGLFAFENVVITSYTSLVGAALSTFVTYLISSIPSLDFEINYPWYAFLATVLFLYVVNVVVGILPIRKILRLPPAQLAAKYDI